MTDAGVPRASAEKALLKLMQSALTRVEKRGIAKGLTGPMVRKDYEVMQRHQARLKSPQKDLYELLVARTFAPRR
jgi:predicted short-subunit dehydrogenase-like oxidoreductase (DUF2520 family)